MKNSDWLPSRREEQLAMAKNWYQVLGGKADAWNVPESIVSKLIEATNIAADENSIPMSERNAVSNARLKAAFDELTAVMRDIKKRYYYNPPLTDADIISLGLKPKDSEPTAVADPVGLATASIKYPNAGALELHLKHDDSTPADAKANYGFRIYYGVYSASDAPPATGEDLRESRFTRQRKQLFTFNPKDSGKTAYFSIRYENSKGKTGQWGKLFSATIP